MNDFRDPTILHSAECRKCGFSYSDGDVLDENGVCPMRQADTDDEEGDPEILVRAREQMASARKRHDNLMDAIFDICGAR